MAVQTESLMSLITAKYCFFLAAELITTHLIGKMFSNKGCIIKCVVGKFLITDFFLTYG